MFEFAVLFCSFLRLPRAGPAMGWAPVPNFDPFAAGEHLNSSFFSFQSSVFISLREGHKPLPYGAGCKIGGRGKSPSRHAQRCCR